MVAAGHPPVEARPRPVAAGRTPRATVKALFNLGSSVVHMHLSALYRLEKSVVVGLIL